LKQCQIVFDVPIVGDAAALDLQEVGGDEGDALTRTLILTPSVAKAGADGESASATSIPRVQGLSVMVLLLMFG
jgi:hypothetical protein